METKLRRASVTMLCRISVYVMVLVFAVRNISFSVILENGRSLSDSSIEVLPNVSQAKHWANPGTNVSEVHTKFLPLNHTEQHHEVAASPTEDNVTVPLVDTSKSQLPSPDPYVMPTEHAIVVPYRNRTTHLREFQKHISLYLQNLTNHTFSLWIIEQDNEELFNRGWLANVGITEITNSNPNTSCIVFHDVDLIPLSKNVPYDECERPVQLGK